VSFGSGEAQVQQVGDSLMENQGGDRGFVKEKGDRFPVASRKANCKQHAETS